MKSAFLNKWFPLISISLLAAFLIIGCNTNPTLSITQSPIQAITDSDLSSKGFVDSSDNKLRISGKSPLLVSIKGVEKTPAAPAGWELLTPIYEISATDLRKQPVTKLPAALSLRFDITGTKTMTILVYSENAWQILLSDFDTSGKLIANIDHLSIFTVGSPHRTAAKLPTWTPVSKTSTSSARVITATTKPLPATPTPTLLLPTRTIPPVFLTLTPAAQKTLSVTQVSGGEASSAVNVAVKYLKDKNIHITSAGGYSGSLNIAVSPALQAALGGAVGASGTAYYGIYNAVNEGVIVHGGGSKATGGLTLLVEPKTKMPASAEEARNQLAALFPGITIPLTQVQASSTQYIFRGSAGNYSYNLGYVIYDNIPIAYAMSGYGTYESIVPSK